MILKALYDYYQRRQASGGDLAPIGFKHQEISFLIVIDKDGRFLRVEDRRIDKKRSQKFVVVSDSRSSGIKPYIFFDNLEYVFGQPKDDKPSTVAKAPQRYEAFVANCREISDKYPDNAEFAAVKAFYATGQDALVKQDEMWQEMVDKVGANVSFLLQGNTEIVASSPTLAGEVAGLGADEETDEDTAICLITGRRAHPVRLSSPTPILNCKSIASLVSFQTSSGYDSYGKSQCFNAPISKEAESSYTTALKMLIGKDSRNNFAVGKRLFLFWSSGSESGVLTEDSMLNLFGFDDSKDDDPQRRIGLVREAFKSIFSGKTPSDANDRFYILGLAPNSARISVVYWNDTDVKTFAEKILRHFDDMEIVDGRKEKRPYYGLRQMMAAVTLGGKSSDVQPNLPEATIASIIQGTPYPFTLYSSAIRRIRAEQDSPMQICRLAIIKAFLNRQNNSETKISVMLDKTNTNPGYLCGRLFAVMEYTQNKANGISTIRERYMNSASATPAAVFATLLNLSVHHAEKLNEGAKINLERNKREIISLLPADGFPAHLDINDQGRFFVGYYHQMQDLWTKKTDAPESNETTEK